LVKDCVQGLFFSFSQGTAFFFKKINNYYFDLIGGNFLTGKWGMSIWFSIVPIAIGTLLTSEAVPSKAKKLRFLHSRFIDAMNSFGLSELSSPAPAARSRFWALLGGRGGFSLKTATEHPVNSVGLNFGSRGRLSWRFCGHLVRGENRTLVP